ncbi:restriction endonuclease subunit S [Winogradskyella thalassocola]|uniref:Type I restriction enzyme, S subunit n=1 Tax=Winogradskyella thalassocola TaxID=262004 RepID=A0A1G8B8W0_9FLAO|nr:restriction endonuclease subunit S [Winogradskyella thalassocola]SDH29541.1 type I restriction enzyme, S subunit [Winogradskyella thalassocola]
MSKNRKTYKLSEVTTKIGSGATPRGGKGAYKESGISLIRSQNVLDFKFSVNGLAFIDEAQAVKLNNVTIEENDVLLNITGDSVARVCSVPKEFLPARVNQHVAIIRADNELLDPKFLMYSLLEKSNKDLLLTLGSAGATRNALTKSMIEDFELQLPPLKEQTQIANILSAIDDKIENNLATNKTLEDMAMALYKHWFVDFGLFQDGEFIDSELGLIPKGWAVKRLDEVAYKNSKTFDFKGKEEVVFVNTGDVQNGSFLHNNYSESEGLPGQAKKVIEPNDILYSEIRPKNKRYAYVDFDSSDYVVSTKFMIIRNNEKIHNRLLYRILTRQDTINEFQMIAESRSGTFPQITFDVIGHFPIVLPNLEIQNNFQSIVSPFEVQQANNLNEIKSLTKLRDTLLPKLISGDLRLKAFRAQVETIL